MKSRGEGRLDLLLATRNSGKVTELAGALQAAPINVISLAEAPISGDIDETGTTFRENAILKAAGYAQLSGRWSLADDSGLEVKALNGAPGIYSARFAGVNTSYEAKIVELLNAIEHSGSSDRSARFVCAMAISDPRGNVVFTAEGVCSGTIADEPSGSGGFGYDPVFVPEGFDMTFAELPAKVKRRISHRARALEQIIDYLLDFTGVSLDH